MAPKMKSRQKASQEYWEEREKEALKQTRLTEEQFAAEIGKIYADMRREVNSRISNWYVRYADESGIDIAEAKKRVSKLDMEEYAELARKYVELARKEETRALAFTDEANEQMKLYNLTMKVNRLENLKAQIGLELCGGFSQLEKKYGTFLNEQMMEEFDRQSGILGMTTQRPEAIRRQAEAVVNGSFHNATFSERLWNQQDALKGELDRLLSRALIQGLNPRDVAPELRKKFGASEQAADLLMITELCRVQTEAQKMAFKEYGYEEYTFICNGGACEACEGLSGKHFKVSEMLAGQNAPPMHPRCRCSTAAYMDREAFDKWLERIAYNGVPRRDVKIAGNAHKLMEIEIPAPAYDRSIFKNVHFRTGGLTPTEYMLRKEEEGKRLASEKKEQLKKLIASGRFSNKTRFQKQNEHIQGTKTREKRVKNDDINGKTPSSFFYDYVDIEKLIAKGWSDPTIKITKDKAVMYFSVEESIGEVYNLGKGKYQATKRVKVEYSSKGKHAYPVKDW